MLHSVSGVRRWSWSLRMRIFWDEVQRSLNWTWLLPFAVIALSIILSHATVPVVDTNRQGGYHTNSSEAVAAKHKPARTARTPDYASNLRNDLELYIPLVGIFLVVPPLAREWQYGTIVYLAMRKSLRFVLLERVGIVLLYLLIVLCGVAAISLLATVQPPDNGIIGPWLWDIICTVTPTTLFCAGLALFVAISTVNVVTGYMVVVGFWSINYFSIGMFTQQHRTASDFLLYTLNGWRVHDQAVHPDQWWIGKLIWLIGGILCILGSLLLLRYEARLIRNLAE